MKQYSQIVWLLIFSLLLYATDVLGVLSGPKQPAEEVIRSFKKNTYAAAVSARKLMMFVQSSASLDTILDQRRELQQTNEELEHTIRLLREENEQLRKQLGAPLPHSYKLHEAFVLGFSDGMEISVGRDQGVEEGMVVISGNSLVGRIRSVAASRSRVQLLFDPDMKVAARTSRGVVGVVKGYVGKSMVLDAVLQKEPLFLDDLVTTSGEDAYPPNILIGKIAKITASDVAVYKSADVQSPVVYATLRMVFVLLSV